MEPVIMQLYKFQQTPITVKRPQSKLRYTDVVSINSILLKYTAKYWEYIEGMPPGIVQVNDTLRIGRDKAQGHAHTIAYINCKDLKSAPLLLYGGILMEGALRNTYNLTGAPIVIAHSDHVYSGLYSQSYSEDLITSLEGGPLYVDGTMDISYNRCTSLQGSPIYVGRNFNCSTNPLESLEGMPKYIGGTFTCSSLIGDKNYTEAEILGMLSRMGTVARQGVEVIDEEYNEGPDF